MTIKINNPKSVRKNPQLIFDELIHSTIKMVINEQLCLEKTQQLAILLDAYLLKKGKARRGCKKMRLEEKMDL